MENRDNPVTIIGLKDANCNCSSCTEVLNDVDTKKGIIIFIEAKTHKDSEIQLRPYINFLYEYAKRLRVQVEKEVAHE